MKQNDYILLIVTVFISVFASIIVSKLIFSSPNNLSQQVDVVPAISTSFPATNSQYFNQQSIDPTQIINIGPGNNQQPFNGAGN
ncbi:MAG TPA: hypothetical protein VIH90_01695 [Candidatus Saccharimonadales bacterium]